MVPLLSRPVRVAAVVSFVVAALCSALFQEPARGTEPDSIAWQDDYAKALENARTSNRLLWVQFTGAWCPNCTRMERDSFLDPSIVEHAQRSFVPLKLRSEANQELAAAFNLTSLPATIIVAPNRDIIAVHQGYLGPEEFDAFLRDCLARYPVTPPSEAPAGSTGNPAAKPNAKDQKPENQAIVALSGFCPVSLVGDRKLVKGQSEFSVEHEGRIYRFASPANSERFRNEPARYVPSNGGSCPVTQMQRGMAKPGEPRWGVIYAGRLFVCASEQDRLTFLENPDFYAMVDATRR
jgi:YHS domain-containing protein/thioredoxin-related protein